MFRVIPPLSGHLLSSGNFPKILKYEIRLNLYIYRPLLQVSRMTPEMHIKFLCCACLVVWSDYQFLLVSHLCFCLSKCLSVYLFVCLSVYVSFCLSSSVCFLTQINIRYSAKLFLGNDKICSDIRSTRTKILCLTFFCAKVYFWINSWNHKKTFNAIYKQFVLHKNAWYIFEMNNHTFPMYILENFGCCWRKWVWMITSSLDVT